MLRRKCTYSPDCSATVPRPGWSHPCPVGYGGQLNLGPVRAGYNGPEVSAEWAAMLQANIVYVNFGTSSNLCGMVSLLGSLSSSSRFLGDGRVVSPIRYALAGPLNVAIAYRVWVAFDDGSYGLGSTKVSAMWLVVLGVLLALAVRYLAMVSFLLSTLPGGVWIQTNSGKLRRSIVIGLFGAATNTLSTNPWSHLGLLIAGRRALARWPSVAVT